MRTQVQHPELEKGAGLTGIRRPQGVVWGTSVKQKLNSVVFGRGIESPNSKKTATDRSNPIKFHHQQHLDFDMKAATAGGSSCVEKRTSGKILPAMNSDGFADRAISTERTDLILPDYTWVEAPGSW
jgi:hypothetical protein